MLLVLICLGSVSAVEDNSTTDTDIFNTQNENIVVEEDFFDEINYVNENSDLKRYKVSQNTNEKLGAADDVSINVRDAIYTENSTITINSHENVSITLQYLLQRPDEIMFSPEIDGYINGEHLSGFGIYREELLVNGQYTTLGSLSNISQSCELDIYLVFKTTSLLWEGYNVESNHIRYIINIIGNETQYLTVETKNVDEKTNATVTVKTNVAGEYVVTVDKDYPIVIDETGVNSVVINALPVNSYDVIVKSKNNESFKNSTILIVSETPRQSANISLREKQHMTDDKEISITFTDSYVMEMAYRLDKENINAKSEEIILYYNGEAVNLAIPVVEGEYRSFTNPTISDEGSLSLKVVYNAILDDDSVFSVESNELVIIFEKQSEPSDISIVLRDSSYPENNTITIYSEENVTIILEYLLEKPNEVMFSPEIDGYINGEHLTGFGIYKEELLVTGQYTLLGALQNISESCELDIYLIFKTTPMFGEGYNVESNHIKYIINIEPKEPLNITLENDENIAYGKNVVVNITGNLEGNYTVSLNNISRNVSIKANETVSVDFGVLDVGSYTVIAYYIGDNENTSFTSSLKVNRAVPEIAIFADEITVGEVLTVKIKISENVSRRVAVKIGNETRLISFVNGSGSAKFSGLKIGTHKITASYNGDGNYAKAAANATVRVNRLGPQINVSADSIIFGEVLVVNVKLSEDVSRRAIVTIGNETKLASLVNGSGSVKFKGLAGGTHTITVSYNGDANYGKASVKTTVKVNRGPATIDVVSNSPAYGESVVVDVKLPSDITRRVSVTIGNESKLVSLKNGSGSVEFTGLKAGTHNVVVSHNGDVNYLRNSINTTVKVKKAVPVINVTANNITAGETAVVEVKLPSDVAKRAVVTVDGVDKLVSLKSGAGSIKLSGLSLGSHEITVSYVGDANYKKTAVSTTLVVEK